MIRTLGFLWLLAALGCGSDSSTPSTSATAADACAKVRDKFSQCGLLDNPKGDMPCLPPNDERERCQADCMLKSSCADLKSSICKSGVPDPEVPDSTPLGQCLKPCATRAFQCKDGSKPDDGAAECDGFEDCHDGSDEASCPMFECKDAQQSVVETLRCDGIADCSDASDEMGCKGNFHCKSDGKEINGRARCDGDEDCADGSDEKDCAMLICK